MRKLQRENVRADRRLILIYNVCQVRFCKESKKGRFNKTVRPPSYMYVLAVNSP